MKFALKKIALFASITRSMSMQVTRSDGQGGKGIVLMPKSGAYSKVVLWFHGLGDSADGWAEMMPSFEDTKFILPTANSIPISINGGMLMNGWSDVHGLSMESVEDKDGFEISAKRMSNIVRAEIEGGIPASKIAIGGFSQGGALALHLSLRSPTAFAGCVALSTWLPLRDDYPDSMSTEAKNLPILQAHGSADQVVSHEWGKGSHVLLKSLISEPEPIFMTIKGMGHSSHPSEMKAVREFLEKHLNKS